MKILTYDKQGLYKSELKIKRKTERKIFALLVCDDWFEVEASGDSESGWCAKLVLYNGIEITVLVDLELCWTIIVEFMQKAKSGLKGSLLPVKSKLCANSLGEGSVVVE